jgi:hypothetical protein
MWLRIGTSGCCCKDGSNRALGSIRGGGDFSAGRAIVRISRRTSLHGIS